MRVFFFSFFFDDEDDDDERDSFMASTSHDGESAYMLGLIRTSVPIHSPHHNECGSNKTHNCTQTRDTDTESAFSDNNRREL